jgi:hypothetical protein
MLARTLPGVVQGALGAAWPAMRAMSSMPAEALDSLQQKVRRAPARPLIARTGRWLARRSRQQARLQRTAARHV